MFSKHHYISWLFLSVKYPQLATNETIFSVILVNNFFHILVNQNQLPYIVNNILVNHENNFFDLHKSIDFEIFPK